MGNKLGTGHYVSPRVVLHIFSNLVPPMGYTDHLLIEELIIPDTI